MSDKRSPPEPADSIATENGADLIARRDAMVNGSFTGPGQADTTTVELDTATEEWLDSADFSVPSVVKMERIRHQNGRLFAQLLGYVTKSWDRLRIVHALVEHQHGVTYDTLEEYVDVSRRTLKDYVYELDDMDAVERGGNPTVVRFPSDEARLLACDAATFY